MPLWRRQREVVRVEGNSARCRCVALGLQRKQGSSHFNRVSGLQKVYFNHCLSYCRSLSLCVLGTRMSCAKTAEPIEMPFGGLTHVGSRNLGHIILRRLPAP